MPSTDDPSARLAWLAERVEETLNDLLPQQARSRLLGERELFDAMRYSLRTPGKRIRPLLLLSVAEMLGTAVEPLLRFASALEMIHAYSLIHDDLPAMDDDDLRRGLPTNHIVYGDGMAILAGDGLLTEAFVVLLEPVVQLDLQLRVVAEIACAAGCRGMVGGQAADLMAEGRQAEEALLRSIHIRKTGALICAAVRAGALLGGAPAAELSRVSCFAEHFGLAFQIADDVKDEIAPPEVTGKRGGGDREAGKMTYPALCGIEGSRERCKEELDQAIGVLDPFAPRAAVLCLLARESVAPAFIEQGA